MARALSTARGEMKRRAPGALAGAAKGFMVGGPAGALVGAAIGGARSRTPAARGRTLTRPTSQQPAAALGLLATILRPEVLQALQALAAGGSGSQTIPVAGQKVPLAAFAGLLQSLAGRAVADHDPPGDHALPRYLRPLAEAGGDPSDPDDRAAALLALLVEAERCDEWDDQGGFEAEDEDDLAESLDLAEIDRLGGID